MATRPDASSGIGGRRRRLRWIAAGVAALVVVGGGTALGLVLTGEGTAPTTSTTAQTEELASIQRACQDWLNASPGQAGSGQWCNKMAAWMSTEINAHGVGPQMMWGDPTSLRSACEHWLAASPPKNAPSDASSWCDEMVSWMRTNVGSWSGRSNWGDWMRHGPMMRAGFETPSDAPSATTPSTRASETTAPTTTPTSASSSNGDNDHDRDCVPGRGDTEHDGDCGLGSGGNSPGMMGGVRGGS